MTCNLKEIGLSTHKFVFFVDVYGVSKRSEFHTENRFTISYIFETLQLKSIIRFLFEIQFSIQNVRWNHTENSDRQFESTSSLILISLYPFSLNSELMELRKFHIRNKIRLLNYLYYRSIPCVTCLTFIDSVRYPQTTFLCFL